MAVLGVVRPKVFEIKLLIKNQIFQNAHIYSFHAPKQDNEDDSTIE